MTRGHPKDVPLCRMHKSVDNMNITEQVHQIYESIVKFKEGDYMREESIPRYYVTDNELAYILSNYSTHAQTADLIQNVELKITHLSAALQTFKSTYESKVVELETKISDCEIACKAHTDTKMTAVNNSIATINNNIKTINGEISDIKKKETAGVDNLQKQIDTLVSTILDLTDEIEDIKKKKDTTIDISLPVGTIAAFAGKDVPEGWLLCDGGRYSKAQYKLLFEAIGTTYNKGQSLVSDFLVPDLRERFLYGTDQYDSIVGKTGGEKEVILTLGLMPEHNHKYTDDGWADVLGLDQVPNTNKNSSVSASSRGNGCQWYTSKTGSSMPHNNMPPFMYMRYIIYYKETAN